MLVPGVSAASDDGMLVPDSAHAAAESETASVKRLRLAIVNSYGMSIMDYYSRTIEAVKEKLSPIEIDVKIYGPDSFLKAAEKESFDRSIASSGLTSLMIERTGGLPLAAVVSDEAPRPQLRQRRGDHRARRPSRTQDARGPARQERRHHEPHRLRGLADSRLRDGPQGARPRGLLLRDPRLGLSDDAHRAGGEVGRGGRGLRGDVPARAHGPRRADRPEGLPRDRRARRQARRLPPLDRALSELVLLDQALGPHVRRPNAHRHAARRAGRTRRHAVDDLERQPTPLRGVPRPAGALRQSRRLRALREAHPALGRGRGRRAPHPAPQHASSCAPRLTPRTRAREGHGRKSFAPSSPPSRTPSRSRA